MIYRKDVLALNFYNESPFTGSYRGMCYRIEKIVEDGSEQLKVTAWPGPYCFDVTDDAMKTSHQEAFSEDGMEAVIAWLNQKAEEEKT